MILKNVEKNENNNAVFEVESEASEFENAVNKAYQTNRSSIYIPGFRKGKAPRTVVEGMYGSDVFYQEALDEIAPAAFDFGLKEAGLRIVGAPSINDVEVTAEKTARFVFNVILYPVVTLGQYKNLEAVKIETVVPDSAVEAEIEAKRKQNARMLSVEDRAAQMGDTVNIDFDGFLDGERFDGGKAEGYSLELGSNAFVPGFEEQIVGMNPGEEKEIDIVFPEDYVENLAGKPVVFKVKVNEISVPEYPELDDEFAKDVSEFDTLDEYKDDIRANLQKKADADAETAFKNEIVQKACNNMTVSIPDVMIDDKVEEMLRNYASQFGMIDREMSREELMKMMGLDEQVVNMSIRPGAEAQVKSELLFEAIAENEAFTFTEEETEAFINSMAENVGASADLVKQYFGMEYILAEQKKEKASELMFETAVPVLPKENTESAVEETAE